MARKDVNFYKVVSNQSMASNYVTPATVINWADNCAYQINITTTDSTGSFTVEVSLDYKQREPSNNIENPGNWSTLTLSGTPVAAAANDTIEISLNQLPFAAMRLRYTSSTAGTGTMSIYVATKQLGG